MIQNLLEIEVTDRIPENPEPENIVPMSIYLNLAEAELIQKQIEEFIDLAKKMQVFVLFMKNEKEVIHRSENDPNDYSLSYLRFFIPLKFYYFDNRWDINYSYCLNILEENKNIKQIRLFRRKSRSFSSDDNKFQFEIGKNEFSYTGKFSKELEINLNQKFVELIPKFDISEMIVVGPQPS